MDRGLAELACDIVTIKPAINAVVSRNLRFRIVVLSLPKSASHRFFSKSNIGAMAINLILIESHPPFLTERGRAMWWCLGCAFLALLAWFLFEIACAPLVDEAGNLFGRNPDRRARIAATKKSILGH